MAYLPVRRIDGALYVRLPDEAAKELHADTASVVRLERDAAGALALAPAPDDVARQMAMIERIMDENDWVLRELAK